MKIFLLGPTGSGKTTAAELYAKKLGYTHIQASKILSTMYPKDDRISLLDYKKYITQKSLEILNKEPNFFISQIQQHIDNTGNTVVIEGIRNPRDFIGLYNPLEDKIWRFTGIYQTQFEEYGLISIDAILRFLVLIYPGIKVTQWEKLVDKSPEDNFIHNITHE